MLLLIGYFQEKRVNTDLADAWSDVPLHHDLLNYIRSTISLLTR